MNLTNRGMPDGGKDRWNLIKEMYFSYHGKLGRWAYFRRAVLLCLVYVILILGITYIDKLLGIDFNDWLYIATVLPVIIICLASSLSLLIRRVNDFNGNTALFVSINLTFPLMSEFFTGTTSILCAAVSTIAGLYVLFRPGIK